MSSFRAVSSFRGVKFSLPPAVWPRIGDAERNLSLLRPNHIITDRQIEKRVWLPTERALRAIKCKQVLLNN